MTDSTSELLIQRYSSDGVIDTTFGISGEVKYSYSSLYKTYSVLQPDQKILISIYSSAETFYAIRFLSTGDIDSSFGTNGVASKNVGIGAELIGTGLLSDGRIIVAGNMKNSSTVYQQNSIISIRFSNSGVFDTTYGNSGISEISDNFNDVMNDIIIQNDNSIIFAGYTSSKYDEYEKNFNFFIARVCSGTLPTMSPTKSPTTCSGSLDTTFGGIGNVSTSISTGNDRIFGITTTSNGKIIAVGHTRNGTQNFAVVQYNSDGSLDSTFGTGGIGDTSFLKAQANAVKVQPNGNIIVAGEVAPIFFVDFAIARFLSNGTLDSSWDSDGMTTASFNSFGNNKAQAIAIQSDGKIVIVGSAANSPNDFGVVRFNSDSTLDTTFSDDGMFSLDFSTTSDTPNAVGLQSDGNIVVAGSAGTTMAVARLTSTGILDTTFDSDGKLTFSAGGTTDSIFGMAIASNGKIVVSGNAKISSQDDIAVVMLNSDGSFDTSFSNDGKFTLDFYGKEDVGRAVSFSPLETKIYVGGFATSTDADFILLRLNLDGTLDSSFGNDGITSFGFGIGHDYAYTMTVQSDGNIIVAGGTQKATKVEFGLIRVTVCGEIL